MSDALALLWLPFVLSIVLVAIHTFLGLQVLARNVVFVDLALAQIAALGATVAFMLGHPVSSSGSYAYSLAFTLAAAVVLASTRSWSQRVPQEALVGVIYVVAAAAAFLVVEKAPQGTEHIKQLLTGNILTTGAHDLAFVTPLYALVGCGLWAARARLARSGEGSSKWLWDFFFYACFGVVVTSSVALAGVLLVFSFLIIPAAIGMLYADGVRRLFIGWAVGVLASCVGLTASYVWDLPTGSTMVCTFGATLAIAGIVWPLRSRDTAAIVARGARVGVALALAASAAWIAIAPREDQPLLDALELVSPVVREMYLSRNEMQIYTDADEYAQRYSREADRLNDKEAQSRWQGEPLSDSDVRRISSFLQSYNEMRRGEEFVKREVRARARTRVRWVLGAVLLVAACAVFPWRLLNIPVDGARRPLRVRPQAAPSDS
ncbi:MAG: manganese transport system permease [Betaproteobacteria bacterium]|nr:manganese transport system permease [Betaproteobacteria bacterium]